MLSLILRRIFCWVWARKNFVVKLLRPFIIVNSCFINFRSFRYFKNYRKYWIPYAHAPFGSGTEVHHDHTHQFLMRMLGMRTSFHIFKCSFWMRVSNWCVHWVCVSRTDVCAEHTHQELMRSLSIRISFLCVCNNYENPSDRKSHTWAPLNKSWMTDWRLD